MVRGLQCYPVFWTGSVEGGAAASWAQSGGVTHRAYIAIGASSLMPSSLGYSYTRPLKSVDLETAVDLNTHLTKIDEARRVARAWAARNDQNEDRSEVLAEIWFDAGKDSCTGRDLEAHLARRLSEDGR